MPSTTPPSPTTVYLVGAGPGDPGLLTVAGSNALSRADICVYDYLANPKLLDLLPPHCERIYVGKMANRHTLTQTEINAVLVTKAQHAISTNTPATIVRLKGGDPYVFGRGGEEGEALHAARIPFVVIPGITSGIAAPCYAGIPVTHRDFATSITLVTGHEKEDADPTEDRVNYPALAALAAQGTLCFYMGVKALPGITAKLAAAGLDPQTPAAVIRWGTHPHQRAVTGTLSTIVDVVKAANITAPAMTVIGKVVSLRDTLNWFESRPLHGKTIIVTRTRQQASTLSASLADLGANVLEAPTIELAEPEDWAPIDDALIHIPMYDWIVFTSANGVDAAWKRLRHLTFDARHFGASSVAAIGPATAEALERIGIVPDLLPEKFVGEELAAALRETIKDISKQRFLLLRADIARPVLREELQKAGAVVDDLPIYRTIKPAALPDNVIQALRDNQVDWITFTSASTANNFHDLLPEDLRPAVKNIKTLSIGPITTTAMQKQGWTPTAEATQHDIPGMVATLQQHTAI